MSRSPSSAVSTFKSQLTETAGLLAAGVTRPVLALWSVLVGLLSLALLAG